MEFYAEAYQQLSSVSAVLGGLAFTAAAALLSVVAGTKNPDILTRSAKITIGAAVVSSICFIISALMWSFMAADMYRAIPRESSFPVYVASKNWIASVIMICGCYLFFMSLGTSGWIATRKLGVVTTIAAIVGGIAMAILLFWFGDIN